MRAWLDRRDASPLPPARKAQQGPAAILQRDGLLPAPKYDTPIQRSYLNLFQRPPEEDGAASVEVGKEALNTPGVSLAQVR
ncbi:hypothetical protein F4W66_24745 (plasmid) [Escherichia coli]|nr:hypothetical protein F4W66_24745 [Escherichia coli]